MLSTAAGQGVIGTTLERAITETGYRDRIAIGL
jgi:hypothetical protein